MNTSLKMSAPVAPLAATDSAMPEPAFDARSLLAHAAAPQMLQKRQPPQLPQMPARQRAGVAGMALSAAGAITLSVLALFDQSAPEYWLAPSPEVLEAASRCDSLADRLPRQMCRQRLVVLRQPGTFGHDTPTRVAAAEAMPQAVFNSTPAGR
jgi:hypothetical protein